MPAPLCCYLQKPNIHPMKKPITAIAMLCFSLGLIAQNNKNNPSGLSELVPFLIYQKITCDQNFLTSIEANSRWSTFKDHPKSGKFSLYVIPSQKLGGLLAGSQISFETFGPFSHFLYLGSLGMIKSSNRMKSGFFFNLVPGVSMLSLNSTKLNWYETEPQQFYIKSSAKFQLGYSGGFWLSFDRKRKIILYNFNSFDVFDYSNISPLLIRVLAGEHQFKWISRQESSWTETNYSLSMSDGVDLTHQLSFTYYSAYYLYGGLRINTLRNAVVTAGVQYTLPGNESSMLDFQYRFGNSLESFGNIAGNSHIISIKFLKNL